MGVAPSKTLAKLANKLAKAGAGVHVLDGPGAAGEALARVTLTDLWGVSTRLARWLAKIGIQTGSVSTLC